MCEETLAHAQFLARHFGENELQYAVSAMLFELKIPMKRATFEYIKNAVILSAESPVAPALNRLYSTVGMMYNPVVGPRQVEQAIRNAVRFAWENRDDLAWCHYFRPGPDGKFPRPTNAEFIGGVLGFVKLWQACCKEVSGCEK